ncbi:MAG: PAS domain S-box protein, partial [Anaerolineae bacterium]|nr:PAS domain S-box protein [Anaerolineae bacterium]
LKTPIRDAEGHVTHVLTVISDITERTHTAAQIAASEDVTRCLIEQSPYGISMVNTEGIVVEWNTAVAQITGIPREDAMGKYLWDVTQRVMPPEAPREELLTRQKQQMLDFLQGKSTFSHNTKVNIQHEDGSRHTLRFSFVLLQTAQGPMAATFIEDITAD